MRGNEEGGEQKVEVNERGGGRMCVIVEGEAARQKASCILLHKLRKLTQTHTHSHTHPLQTHWRILKEQFVGQLGDMETH